MNRKYNKCFWYTKAVTLNYKKIGKRAERITKIKPFIKKYNWERINFPPEKNDLKKVCEK